jgi:hypothetical protein
MRREPDADGAIRREGERVMFELLWRLGAFLLAAGLLVDGALPVRASAVKVDHHHTAVSGDRHVSNTWTNATYTDYYIDLSDGLSRSCEVGKTAWDALKDGDDVVVDTTRITHSCVRLLKDGQIVSDQAGWRLWRLIPAALLLAYAFGFISTPNLTLGSGHRGRRRGRYDSRYDDRDSGIHIHLDL